MDGIKYESAPPHQKGKGMRIKDLIVVKAPEWLKRRMRILRSRPKPTIQEVEIQLRASATIRAELEKEQA
jgi:hypothetical protein